ncbi:Amino Acid/Auxin Permease (AAAP) Family [Thraustotheca clavata]|uniref:Amino Acid/Auxin Permease (AAAP) Family n=1 Tax=Thraustotheca clavata TaxID=74557 RepID=A0A1V9ZPT6_9STRA|nr:Amino Acid/Auxin Permease (AAAP) Family [Thraustotheca clavata]
MEREDTSDVPLLRQLVVDEYEPTSPEESFVEKYITSRMQPGSVKGSMFTLTISIVGAGVLALPYAVNQVGVLLGIALILLGSFLAYYALFLLVICSDISKAMSYMNLAHVCSGPKLAVFVQSVICTNLLGTAVGFFVASSELILLVVKPVDLYWGDSMMTHRDTRNALIGALCLCFVYPLSLFRSLSSLRFSSLFSILCIVFLTITVVVKYFQFVKLGFAPDFWYQWHHLTMLNFAPDRLLTAIPLVVFAFTCHPNVLPIYLQLKRRSSPRMYKVARRSLGVASLVYLLLSTFAVFTFGDKTLPNFLENDYHQDAAIIAASIFLGVSIVITTPLYIHTLRNCINEIVWENDGGLVRHTFVTTALVGFAVTLALLATDIASVLGILGATTNPIICFIMPAYYVCKLGGSSVAFHKYISVIIAVVLSTLSVCSLVHQLSHTRNDPLAY